MMLLHGDLALIFMEHRGIKDDNLAFQTVSAYSNIPQSKGLYIPLYGDSGELKTAIDNGAIAAIWPNDLSLPGYTPNDFPVFFVDNLWKGLMNMIVRYEMKRKANEEKENETSWFVLQDKSSLNKKPNTYDISVITKEIKKIYQQRLEGGRE
jgi:hypothetical protein